MRINHSFDVDTAVFPADCAGKTFAAPGGEATIETVPDGTVCVGSYSPGIVGMLARAFPAIEAGQREGVVEWFGHSVEWSLR